MNMKEFMDFEDDIEKYAEGKLGEIADCFYQFTHGFYDLSKVGYPDKHLKDSVPHEYKGENCVLKKHFDVIYKLEDALGKLRKILVKMKKVSLLMSLW